MQTHIVAQAVQALQAELANTPGVIGVVFFGSAQRGDVRAHSDLDLYVLHSGAEQWNEGRRHRDLMVELSFSPVRCMRQHVAARNPVVTHAFATGTVLLDRTGEVAELVVEARERWSVGPEPASPSEQLKWRFRLTDLLFDLLDESPDQPDAMAIGALLVQRSVEASAACRGYWPAPRRGMLATLEQREPDLAPLVASYYSVPTVSSAAAVGRAVLAALGGELIEYKTEPRTC